MLLAEMGWGVGRVVVGVGRDGASSQCPKVGREGRSYCQEDGTTKAPGAAGLRQGCHSPNALGRDVTLGRPLPHQCGTSHLYPWAAVYMQIVNKKECLKKEFSNSVIYA